MPVPLQPPTAPPANGTAHIASAEELVPTEQPAPAGKPVAAEPNPLVELATDVAAPAGTIFDSEDWDDGDAGWPPPEVPNPCPFYSALLLCSEMAPHLNCRPG